MANMHQIGKHATKVTTETVQHGEVTRVRYHYTNVVTVDGDYVTLRSDGWATATTKTRMNQASNELGLGYSVYQKNYEWFVVLPTGETVEYYDGITFPHRKASRDALSADEWAKLNGVALPHRLATKWGELKG